MSNIRIMYNVRFNATLVKYILFDEGRSIQSCFTSTVEKAEELCNKYQWIKSSPIDMYYKGAFKYKEVPMREFDSSLANEVLIHEVHQHLLSHAPLNLNDLVNFTGKATDELIHVLVAMIESGMVDCHLGLFVVAE